MQPSYSERQLPLRGKGRAEQQPAIDQLEDLGGAGGLCNAAFVAIQAWVLEDLRGCERSVKIKSLETTKINQN